MIIINILIGLVGLGLVILVHETGHFAAAKLFGIDVEAFSIGWGKKLFGITRGGTEYRISMIPIGGYCKMKGEQMLRKALEDEQSTIPKEPGSFYGVSPWKRLGVAVAGPGLNLIFAALVFSVIWFIGFKIHSYESKIILVSEYAAPGVQEQYAADRAGLETGDRIIAAGKKRVEHYSDLQEIIAINGGKTLDFTVTRGERTLTLPVTLGKDAKTGVGQLGIYAWIEPVVDEVKQGSAAHIAGLMRGAVITAADGKPVRHTIDFMRTLSGSPSQITITYERQGASRETVLRIPYGENGEPDLGFSFAYLTFKTPRLSIFRAAGKGLADVGMTLRLSLKSIGMLFQGINVREAVSGPIRITYIIGETASYGFKFGLGGGLATLFRFLSLLSVAVFVMNLLPIPALDGGMVVISVIEGIFKKPLRPKAVYRYQIVGFTIIIALVLFTTFNDVFFLIKR
ncbi:MAG: RIP metalloprotease RseP [Spirochaetales bacterium]|nr:MAG: RIP metalloprotease RseP [Spirochaetales bacterium]